MLIAGPHLAWAQAGPEAPGAQASAPGAEQKTLRFSRFRTVLRFGDSIGDIRTGSFCGSQTGLTMNARTEQAVMAPAARVVREEFLAAGYRDPLRSQQERLFDDDTDRAAPDLLLGGMLEEFNASYCSSGSGSSTDGRVRVKVRWELYDTAARKVVHTQTTEGVYQTRGTEPLREGEFFGQAYREAVRKLLTDRHFQEASLASPAAGDGKPAASGASPVKMALKRVAPLDGALTSNMTLTRAAVVTVNHSGGSGSGFFVSESGYVLTNDHVVGTNRFVRVILATGRELVGEVVQRDASRDAALIKTEGSNFAALAVNTEEVNIGSEVIAIGSPLGEALSGTVTRGIVSAYRTIKGKRFIQSDVSVLPGSSGGPLLDKSGRVVGITVAGLGGGRINFFVPIQEALASLGITIDK